MEEEFKVAFVIGHHREVKGSYSKFLKKYEYDFWKEYANSYLKDIGDVFEHEPGPIYKERQRLMANKTKEYDLVIELHFNGFNGESNGSEVLVYAGNEYTAKTGTLVSTMMASSMKYVNRGIKKLDNGNQNGYWFLRLMRGEIGRAHV